MPPPVGLPASSGGPEQEPFRCRTCILYRHSLADTQASLMQVKNFASAQRDLAKLKADLARRTMAAAYCFREAFLAKASAAADAGDTPLDMTEEEISALVPIATLSIPRIGGRISTVSPQVNASAEAAITAGLNMPQSTPIPLANPSRRLATSGLSQSPLTTDSGPVVDMFGSSDEEADGAIPPAVADMFQSDDEDAALAAPPAVDMFGDDDEPQPIDDTHNVNAMDIFGSDEELSASPAHARPAGHGQGGRRCAHRGTDVRDQALAEVRRYRADRGSGDLRCGGDTFSGPCFGGFCSDGGRGGERLAVGLRHHQVRAHSGGDA